MNWKVKMAFSMAMDWNEGEEKMHDLLKVPDYGNPTSTMLTQQATYLLQRAPLLAIGALDSEERPWTSLWGGAPAFSEPLGGNMIGTRTLVDGENDPVVQALVGNITKGEMVQGHDKLIAGLTIDLMTRKRVKIAGRMIAGSLGEVGVDYEDERMEIEDAPEKQDRIQLITKIEQSLGNCPKYLNQYEIEPALINSKLLSSSAFLIPEAKDLIKQADMFFVSSSTSQDMDTNHRGGPAGFVRILSDNEIVYPEYSGNRLYQSLGNLQINPRIGITFPNYETGNVLYITGTTQILTLSDAAKLLPGSNLAVKIKIEEARFVEQGLGFRGVKKIPSPYNPLVRTLATEGNIKSAIESSRVSAQLIKKTKITPSTARFTFSVPEGLFYKPGQWIALDFSENMDMGYSHMRDDDPRSLNDDHVRTFTISSSPSSENGATEKEFEITIRNVGVVTEFLFRQNDRTGFEVPVLSVGGEFKIHQEDGKLTPFVAGGVGITPLLGELKYLYLNPTAFRLLWTLRLADIDLVIYTLEQYPALAECTEVYFTGSTSPVGTNTKTEKLESKGVKIHHRRLEKSDVDTVGVRTWYLCAAKPLRKSVLDWLQGRTVIFEDFDY